MDIKVLVYSKIALPSYGIRIGELLRIVGSRFSKEEIHYYVVQSNEVAIAMRPNELSLERVDI